MIEKEKMPILKKDGEIVVTESYGNVIYYAVKVGKNLILKKSELKEEKK